MSGHSSSSSSPSSPTPSSSDSPSCDCREARLWREYWTRDAIAERVAEEIDRARRASYDGWHADIDAASQAFREAPRPKLHNVPTFEELTRRRRGT